MPEYIEREAAKNAIMDYIGEQTMSKYTDMELCRASRMGAEGAMNELDYVPTADVVEVVRCKDCKYYDRDQCYHERHDHHAQSIEQEADDFCSYGAKMDGKGDVK